MTSRRILLFLVCLVLVWAVLQFLVWPRVQPAYSAAVTRAADAALGLIEAGDRVTHLRAQGGFIHAFSELRDDAEPAATFDANVLHFYAVLFASVILTFPSLSLRRRAGILVIAMAGLFAFHVATVLVNVEHMYAVQMARVSQRNYSDAQRAFWGWLEHTMNYFAIDLLPAAALVLLVVVEGGLGLRGMRGMRAAPTTEGSDAESGVDVRKVAAAALVLLALPPAALYYINYGKVRARQAEKEAMLGSRALAAQGFAQAAEMFEAALSRNPRFVEAHEGLGQTRLRQGRIAEAIAEFRAALELEPDSPTAHLHLGNALYATADYAGAAEQFEASDRLNPAQRETLFDLAMAQKKLGKRADAEANLRRVLEISPEFGEALFELSVSMITTNRACGAREYLRRIVALEAASNHGNDGNQGNQGGPGSRAELAKKTLEDLAGRCGGD